MNRTQVKAGGKVSRWESETSPLPTLSPAPLLNTHPGISASKWAEIQLRDTIERLAEVCWEATRAWLRSEFNSSTACDGRIPPKWVHAGQTERAAAIAAVLLWWEGGEEAADAPEINHICRDIVRGCRSRMGI